MQCSIQAYAMKVVEYIQQLMQYLYAIICKVSTFHAQNVVKNSENIKALFYVT